jgi:hypothetical protein
VSGGGKGARTMGHTRATRIFDDAVQLAVKNLKHALNQAQLAHEADQPFRHLQGGNPDRPTRAALVRAQALLAKRRAELDDLLLEDA